MTTAELRRAFRAFNRLYFDGKVPANTRVRFKKLPPALLGEFVGAEPYEINISVLVRNWHSVPLMTLLHEMVHAYLHVCGAVRDMHGPRFQREMLRLAKAGAFRRLW